MSGANEKCDIGIQRLNTQEEPEREFQVSEEPENCQRQREREFDHARERLAQSRAELEKLTAEYRAMPDKIRLAEWHFHQALRLFNEVKSLVAGVS